MVLDTRWKRFKYSNGNKWLCVVLALVMAAVFVINGFSLIKCVSFFNDDDFINTKDRSFYSSYLFSYSMNRDIQTIVEHVTYDENVKKYYEAEAAYVEKAMALYRAEEETNRLSDEEIADYERELNASGINAPDYNYFLDMWYGIYDGEDGYYYRNDFDFDKLTTADYYGSYHLDFGHTDERAQELLEDHFSNDNYNSYVPDDFYWRWLGDLKNIKYYGVSDQGAAYTNVADPDSFVNGIKAGEGDYIVFENNKLSLSDSLEPLREKLWENDKSGCRIYITVNTDFTGVDEYADMFGEYKKVADVDVMATLTVMVISLIAIITFAVMSVRLAGHTENGISIAVIDKFPHDLHFVITVGLAVIAGIGIGSLVALYDTVIQYGYYENVERVFCTSNAFIAVLVALAWCIYLLIIEFATSLARAIKAELPIGRKSLIYNAVKLIIKAIVFIFKYCISGFFKLIFKGIKKLLHLLGSLVFKPKRLDRKLICVTVLYTLFNIISILIIILFFASYEDLVVFCGFFGIIVLLALDTYAVYRAVKYLKALDDIIDTSAKREPLPYDTSKLPQSLKTLADSLEATNAELQEAVRKAVKDERTKTELITNVSHDLKTPLTSIINYIDLLKKCNIKNETAKQYIDVIDEKSGRLKRLIEDLIEASKVSTGNITLNKTKLNLGELASQAIVEETADIEKNNLHIIFDEAADRHIVYADGTKIYRVFENLLANARKYSAPGTRIYAGVYSDNNFGYFEIKNISKDPLNISAEELTERFVRGDKSRSQDGNGLGLSIAKELCRLNDGELIITIDGDLFKATVKLPKGNTKE